MTIQGRSQDLGGGGEELFFSDLEIGMSLRDMPCMAKPCALLGGFGACKNFFNGAIWCVFCANFIFKIFQKILFLYKKINTLDTRLLLGITHGKKFGNICYV